MRNKNNILLYDRLSTEDLTMTCARDPKSCEALSLMMQRDLVGCSEEQQIRSG
jgi:hypothetical protein